MLGDFDIDAAAKEILSERVVESEGLSQESPTLDGGNSNMLVDGNVAAGATVKGLQSLLVKGSLIGSERWPCRIEVLGDVVVMGDVKYAQVACRNLRVGAEARDCRLSARAGVEIGENLTNARIVIGEFEPERQAILELRQEIRQVEQRTEYTRRQLALEQKRVHRQFVATQFSLDFSAGQILHQRRNQVVIDLRPFYKVVGDRNEAEIDQTLRGFFAKAVVGLLTRTNRHLIRQNPNRQKIFKSVIRDLHDLVFLTRDCDKQSSTLSDDESRLEELMDALNDQMRPAYVRGTVVPDVDMQFVLPHAARAEDGGVEINMETAKLSIRPGEGSDERDVTDTDTFGEESVETAPDEDLRGLLVRVCDGRVTREGLDAPKGAPSEENG